MVSKGEIYPTYHLLCSFLSIHEALGNNPRCEDLVALAELLEENAVGKTKAANSDALQHTIAT